jgi:uncharacterized protein (TIGR03437 family)
MQNVQTSSLKARCLFLLLFAVSALSLAAQTAGINVLTDNYNNARTNANLKERVLSTLNVNPSQFGKLFSLPVTGAINSQPLYVQSVSLANGSTHNVVYVTTHHNDVYAFDADKQGAALWHVNLGPPVPGADFEVADLSEIGILGTPVIDDTTNTLYVVAYTKEEGKYFYRLHALDIGTSHEKLGAPVVISATVPGTSGFDSNNGQITFAAGDHLQRPGLLLLNGVVYIGFGSHSDVGMWHGWLLGYNAANVQQQVSAFITSPGGWGSGIWQGGRAPAADAEGNIYAETGNGTFDGNANWGESLVKLSTASGALTLTDWFTPDNWSKLNDLDNDFGSCGPVLASSGWVIGGAKEGVVYLMDQNNLGHTQAGNNQILQHFQAVGFGIYNMAFWDRLDGPILYLRANGDVPKAFEIINGQFQTTPMSQASARAGLYFDGMAISANGSAANSAIFWLTATKDGIQDGAGTLYAFDALDLSKELWNSDMNSARNGLGTLAKFTAPTVANGKVYVATFSGSLMVYGLLSQKALVGQVVNSASGYAGPVAPGELVSIYGTELGPAVSLSTASAAATDGKLSTKLGGTQVFFGGTAAPLEYVNEQQVTAVVPDAVASHNNVVLQVLYKGQTTPAMQVPVAATAPGLFTADGSGSGQGVILNQDASVNATANPAARGSVVSLFATGQGMTDPPWPDGTFAAEPYPKPVSQVTATIGGQAADVLDASAAPGTAAIIQINVRVPSGIKPSGATAVVVTIGGVKSQPGVTLAVE